MRSRFTEGTCNHFNGTTNKKCDAGVEYETVRLTHEPLPIISSDPQRGHTITASVPCMTKYNPGSATCDKCEMPTSEQIAQTKADDARRDDLMRRGLSGCCEAPIDERAVIREGRHKGHGMRYCSKCGKYLFMV